jgi:hypothetical protein
MGILSLLFVIIFNGDIIYRMWIGFDYTHASIARGFSTYITENCPVVKQIAADKQFLSKDKCMCVRFIASTNRKRILAALLGIHVRLIELFYYTVHICLEKCVNNCRFNLDLKVSIDWVSNKILICTIDI